jgi:hypothetical protein
MISTGTAVVITPPIIQVIGLGMADADEIT